MKRLIEWGGFCAVMLLAGVSATGAVPKQTATKAILEKDAVCTACHNETWATAGAVDLPDAVTATGPTPARPDASSAMAQAKGT